LNGFGDASPIGKRFRYELMMRKDRNSGKFQEIQEFSDSEEELTGSIFWQNFLLTMAGACGLISMVADGPRWITYPAELFVIVLIIHHQKAEEDKQLVKSGLKGDFLFIYTQTNDLAITLQTQDFAPWTLQLCFLY
jgi:hypothetical protein